MAIILRLLALVILWGFSRWRPAASAGVLLGVDRLSWSRKAQLVWRLVQDNRVPLLLRGVILLPALYIASPIDLLPDFVPFVGRMDDAAVFSIAMDLLIRFTPVEIASEHLDAVLSGGRQRPGARERPGAMGSAGA
ncbi:MAG: DUF1232 domain-containing protein [Dehalococcoidia bacterium]|nr:DUF1232 domain-containing protein [Dehalococcoidia bacterium]